MTASVFSHGAATIGRELDALTALVRTFTVQVQGRGAGDDSRAAASLGSGIVWHPDGLIITNAHVVRDRRLAVMFASDEVLDAELVARDDRRDLALLHVDARLPRIAPQGDPSTVRPGALVLALGHPLGVRNALSMGVVHTVTQARGRPRWIAADVALAPGSSGGPLVDASGRLLGINTMVMGGLGVAIASNIARRFFHEAVAGGAVTLSAPLAA